MTTIEPSFSVNVDVTNSGQFFACCGLLELAHRLRPGAEGWFEDDRFRMRLQNMENNTVVKIVCAVQKASLTSDDVGADHKTCPLRLGEPFDLRLDWWLDQTGGDRLKTWAGQQSISRIAPAMKEGIPGDQHALIFEFRCVVTDPAEETKPVEPFYFDARRFAHALDTGFSLDVQNAETVAHPAVEFFCLVGLQRFRPSPTPMNSTFDYWTWSKPLTAPVAAGVVSGCVPAIARRGYRFRLQFRDDQKRYKAFSFGTPIGDHT